MKTKAMFFLLSCLFTSLSFAVVKDSDINKALDEQRTSAIFKVNNKPENLLKKLYQTNDSSKLPNVKISWIEKSGIEDMSEEGIITSKFQIIDETNGINHHCEEQIFFGNYKVKVTFASTTLYFVRGLANNADVAVHYFECSSKMGGIKTSISTTNRVKILFDKNK